MFYFESRGHGRPVVFLHGFLESSAMWKEFIDEKFDKKIQSICIDLPGHGKSILDKEYLNLSEIAFEIYQFLQLKGFNDFDVVGHSLGGYIAIELHKLLPKKSKLILFHSNFWEDEEERKENRNRTIKVVQENKALFIQQAIPNLFSEQYRKESFVHELIQEAKNIKVETIVMYSQLMRDRPSNEVYVKNVEGNFLFIQGIYDQIIPINVAKMYLDEINFTNTNAGHMGHFESKIEEREIILNFFEFFSNQI